MRCTEFDLTEYDDESTDPSLQSTKSMHFAKIKFLIDPNWTLRRCAITIIKKLADSLGATKILSNGGLAKIVKAFLQSAPACLDPFEAYSVFGTSFSAQWVIQKSE